MGCGTAPQQSSHGRRGGRPGRTARELRPAGDLGGDPGGSEPAGLERNLVAGAVEPPLRLASVQLGGGELPPEPDVELELELSADLGDVGFTIVAQVAPNGLWGSSVNSAPSSVVVGSAPASGPPVNSVRPVISGTAQVGQWLSVSNGTWSPPPTSYAYAWHRCNSAGTSCSLSPSSS